MIKATVKANGVTTTKRFDTIGQAMKWVREFAPCGKVEIFDKSGNLYYNN